MPGNTQKTIGFRAVLASVGLALLLAACGTGADSDASLETPPAHRNPVVEEVVAGQPLAPAVIGIVKLAAGQTIEDAAKAYDGRPIRDRKGSSHGLSIASTDGTSIEFLAFDSMPALPQMVDSESEFDIVFEENLDRFATSAGLVEVYGTGLETQGRSTIWAEGTGTLWAEGRSTIWAEGRSTIWAEGRSSLWAEGRSSLWAEGGDFIWLPENTPVWKRLNLRDAHSEAKELGRNVVVAVIDTGIDMNHPALADAISPLGWNFVDNNDDPSEVEIEGSNWSFGHGTIVADIVRQIAPGATILPIRALEADGSGDVFNVVRAVYYAVDEGEADIINMSLGGPEESPALTEAIRYANAQGVFVTISAGNDNKASLNYPSAIASDHDLNYVISVTSVDSDDVKSHFSNWGVGAEIAAFGEGIVGPYPDYGLAQWSGTSMAAPQVAGALALAMGQGRSEWEEHPRKWADIMFEEGVSLYSGSGPKNQNRQYRDLGDGVNVQYPLGRSRLDIEEFIDEAVDD